MESERRDWIGSWLESFGGILPAGQPPTHTLEVCVRRGTGVRRRGPFILSTGSGERAMSSLVRLLVIFLRAFLWM